MSLALLPALSPVSSEIAVFSIDAAREMGAEAFMVDAGWFGGPFGTNTRGDWNEGDWLPEGGLSGVGEYVHKKGMLRRLCADKQRHSHTP